MRCDNCITITILLLQKVPKKVQRSFSIKYLKGILLKDQKGVLIKDQNAF